MKIIKENIDIESTDSLSEYFMLLKRAINDETTAIELYDTILNNSTIPTSSKDIIQEILDDERDHLVILGELLNDEIEEELPGYGDFPEDDEDDSIKIIETEQE